MKKLCLWAIALLSIFMVACKDDEDNTPTVQYSAEDVEGIWLWITADGNPIPYNEIFWANYQDGVSEYWDFDENGKWVTGTSTYTFKDNILTEAVENVGYKVIYADAFSLICESEETSKQYVAEKVINTDIQDLIGTWYCDSLNIEMTFNADSTYTRITSSATTSGEYGVNNSFYWYEKSDGTGGYIHYSIDMGKSGPEMTQIWVDTDGTMHTDVFLRKQMANYTLEDMAGVWITTAENGVDIPLEKANITEFKGNNVIVRGMSDGKWGTSDEIELTLDGNNLNFTLADQPYSFSILYFDASTIIWKRQMDGNIITRKRIMFPDEYKDAVQGFWYNESATLENGATVDMKWIASEDSVYVAINDSVALPKAYKLYGDIFVCYDETEAMIFPISFGYDPSRGEALINHHFLSSDGKFSTTTLYKMDLEKKLDGAWLWIGGNGEKLPTSEVDMDVFNSVENTCLTIEFKAGTIINDSYKIQKHYVMYPDNNDYPYDIVKSITDSTLEIINPKGDSYFAVKINPENSLRSDIIGEWTCASLVEEDTTFTNVTYKFEKNGLVTFSGESSLAGTYSLYNRLLVMSFVIDGSPKNILWEVEIVDGTMTFERLLSNGTTLKNTLAKKIEM